MSGGSGQRARDEVRVRLVADPVSVPAARQFVRDTLSAWNLSELAEDASLCISELTSNAALHSDSQYVDIVLDDVPGAVRLYVDDQGVVPAAAVVQRRYPLEGDLDGLEGLDGLGDVDTDALLSLEALTSTGRGLMIVSAVATDWGVHETDCGKRVWAQLTYDAEEAPVPPPGPPPPAPGTAPPAPGSLPGGWYVVRLAGCPVQLSLQQDRHLDDLIRELQLVDAGDAEPSRELAGVIAGLLQDQAQARHMGRLTAQEAAAKGMDTVDIDMTLPEAAADAVEQLDHAVRAADDLCRQQQLLTLASPPEVVLLREWMAGEIKRQIRHGEQPVPWAAWLEAHG